MENYRIKSIYKGNGEQRINQDNGNQIIINIYQQRVGGHYKRVIIDEIAEEKKKLLEQIASNNEIIINKFGLNKLKVSLEVTTYN